MCRCHLFKYIKIALSRTLRNKIKQSTFIISWEVRLFHLFLLFVVTLTLAKIHL